MCWHVAFCTYLKARERITKRFYICIVNSLYHWYLTTDLKMKICVLVKDSFWRHQKIISTINAQLKITKKVMCLFNLILYRWNCVLILMLCDSCYCKEANVFQSIVFSINATQFYKCGLIHGGSCRDVEFAKFLCYVHVFTNSW